MHNYLSEQRGKWVDEHCRELELHNASAEKSITYVSSVQTLLYTAGYAIYNEDDRLVFLYLKRAPGIGRAFTYLLPQKMELTSFTANEDEFFRRPKGEVIDLEAVYDSGTNKFFLWQAMKYLVENYSAELPRVGALDQCPVGMTDGEWRMWVLISHNHHRVDFP